MEIKEITSDANFRYYLVGIFFVVIILVGFIDNILTTTWYQIYLTVSIVTLIGTLILAVAHVVYKDEVPAYNIFGVQGQGVLGELDTGLKFFGTVALALIFGMGIVLLIQSFSFSIGFLLPATNTSSSSSPGLIANIVNLFVVGFVAPDREEEFRQQFITPLLSLMFTFMGFGPPLILIGLVVTVLLAQFAEWIGVVLILVGIALIAYEALQSRKQGRLYHLMPSNSWLNLISSGVFGAIFFAALHGYAFSELTTFQAAIVGAFLFGFTMWFFNTVLGNSVFSREAHSAYNSTTYVLLNSLSLLYIPVMPVLYAIMLFGLLKPEKIIGALGSVGRKKS